MTIYIVILTFVYFVTCLTILHVLCSNNTGIYIHIWNEPIYVFTWHELCHFVPE